MRKTFCQALLALVVVFSTITIAKAKSAKECTDEKMLVLKALTANSVATQFRRHFSIESLAHRVIGGSEKWKHNPQRHAEILARFQDSKRIQKLYEQLQNFKGAQIVKYFPVADGVSIRISAQGKMFTVRIQYEKTSCKIVHMCTVGRGCIHQLF
jgi:hypothetical protein